MNAKPIHTFHTAISKCQLLDGLSPAELRELGEHVRLQVFHKGNEILTEGNIYQGLWAVLSGTCEVVKFGSQPCGVLATLEPGSVFGEMSFFEGVAHSATVRCCEDVTAFCLTKKNYDELGEAHPHLAKKLAINLVRILSSRLRHMDDWTCKLVATQEHSEKNGEWQEFRARLYSDIFD